MGRDFRSMTPRLHFGHRFFHSFVKYIHLIAKNVNANASAEHAAIWIGVTGITFMDCSILQLTLAYLLCHLLLELAAIAGTTCCSNLST
jgi:hypothetical protein